MAQNVSKTTTDHDTIRRWVEERGGSPAEVEATAGEGRTGLLRIDLPGSGEGALRRVEWDEWFRRFDESGLAFVYEDETAGGERSSFNELVARETTEAGARGGRTPVPTGGGERARGRTGKRASGAGGGARKTASRGGGRKAAARGASRRKVGGAVRRKPRTGGRRVAARSAAARTTRGTSRAGGRRTTRRRGGGRATRRSK